jgi:predicted lipoprotein with Yx(FWY)xxD motif
MRLTSCKPLHDRRDHEEETSDRTRSRFARVGVRSLRRAADQSGTTAKGAVLTDAKGMTLYTFDKDADGKSACNGPCATNWPVLKAEASDKAEGGYTIIKRDDGSMQWAYKGKPLYTFAKDQKAGDITGDGFLNGAWHLATP